MNKFLALLAATMIGALLTSAAYVTGSLSIAPAHAGEVIRDHPVVHGVVAKATGRACPEEDSVNCYWNARVQGNGKGHSFYSIRVGGRTCYIYWNARYNRHHGECIK